MRTVLGILRRGLKILGWIGCGLSALLFAATVVLWGRSMGHQESWFVAGFEPRPDWRMPELAEWGIRRWWAVEAIHGRLWLGVGTSAPDPWLNPEPAYQRVLVSAWMANQHFDSSFRPGDRPYQNGTEWAWRFAGAGFVHQRTAVDPQIGRPHYERSSLAVPFWMLTVLFGLWPGLVAGRRVFRWRRNRLRRKRLGEGLCLHCGYDLRATPDPAGPRLERCPECGRAANR